MIFSRYFALLGLSAVAALGASVTLDNGLSGVGRWEVILSDGASSSNGSITNSTGTYDVLYAYRNSVQVGAGGAIGLTGTTTTQTALNQDGAAVSGGSFNGQNGAISWTATSWITPGSPVLTTRFDFTSANPFGAVRFFNYLDEDVISASANNLISFGDVLANDLQLLTVHSIMNLGVAQSASYTPAGASFAGWGIHGYGTGHDYDVAMGGSVTAPVITGGDPRYPGRPAYGTADMISVLGFDLSPNANTASITLSLGGSPTGQPIPTTNTPEPATVACVCSGLLGVVLFRRRASR